jgi:hypothetical protein
MSLEPRLDAQSAGYNFRELAEHLGVSVERLMRLEATGAIAPPESLARDRQRHYTAAEARSIAAALASRDRKLRNAALTAAAAVLLLGLGGALTWHWGGAPAAPEAPAAPLLAQEAEAPPPEADDLEAPADPGEEAPARRTLRRRATAGLVSGPTSAPPSMLAEPTLDSEPSAEDQERIERLTGEGIVE